MGENGWKGWDISLECLGMIQITLSSIFPRVQNKSERYLISLKMINSGASLSMSQNYDQHVLLQSAQEVLNISLPNSFQSIRSHLFYQNIRYKWAHKWAYDCIQIISLLHRQLWGSNENFVFTTSIVCWLVLEFTLRRMVNQKCIYGANFINWQRDIQLLLSWNCSMWLVKLLKLCIH